MAQALYMQLLSLPSGEKEEEASEILSNGLFATDQYLFSVEQLKAVYSLCVCLQQTPASLSPFHLNGESLFPDHLVV